MLKYLFRLKALFQTVTQQREELTDHRQKTRRAFLKFKRDQRKSERGFASHEKLIKALSLQVKHLVEQGQLPHTFENLDPSNLFCTCCFLVPGIAEG